MTIESRMLAAPQAELRVEGTEAEPVIVGYAALFNTRSEPIAPWGFREIIKPGAFRESLKRGDDVIAVVDHDFGKNLGRRSSGTLKLKEDRQGLRVEITPPDTTIARDTLTSMRRGDTGGMSFQFFTVTDNFRMEDGEELREVKQVDLVDVSVVNGFAAYPQTKAQVDVRSYEKWRASLEPANPMQLMKMLTEMAALE